MKTMYSRMMKTLTFVMFLVLVTISACKKDNPQPEPTPTPAELQIALLKGPAWVMQGVKVDDVVVDLYKDLTVSFTEDKKYTSVNGGVVWPANGTWSFKDDQAKIILRDDGLEITIEAITDKAMTISFTRTGETVFEPGGRTKAVSGKHVMTLGR